MFVCKPPEGGEYEPPDRIFYQNNLNYIGIPITYEHVSRHTIFLALCRSLYNKSRPIVNWPLTRTGGESHVMLATSG